MIFSKSVKTSYLPLILAASLLCLTDAFGQVDEIQTLKDLDRIELTLYQNPIAAKYRLQKLIANQPKVSDTTRALLYLKWGISLGMTNNLDSAIWAVKESYQFSPDDYVNKGSALKILASLYRLKGNYKKAEEALVECLRLNRSIWKNPIQDALTLQEYGSLCLDQFDYAKATNLYLQALDTIRSPRFDDSRKPMLMAKVRINLAEAYLKSENYKMAIREFELSRPTLDSIGDVEAYVRTGEALARAYLALRLFDKTDSLLNNIYPLTEKLQNDELKAYALLGKGNSLAAQGKLTAALSNYQKSFAILDKNRSAFILECVNPYIETLMATGAEAEARQVISKPSVQSAIPTSLPPVLLEFRKNAIKILWKDKTAPELHAYYQDLIQLADSVYQAEKRKSALEAQAKYQFERQKEAEEHLLSENALLKEKEGLKKTQLLMSIAIGLLGCFILLLIVRRLRLLSSLQAEKLAAKEIEIQFHKDYKEWSEREKELREQLIQQQKNVIAKSIADAEQMREQLDQLVLEQQQSKREEILMQIDLVKQDYSSIELLMTQFNALNPLFAQVLMRQFPKLSQADLQYCALVRMNLTTKEIASLLNIEPRSIYVKKYRIMEKMNLNKDDDFERLIFEVA